MKLNALRQRCKADEFYDDCVNLGVTDVTCLTPGALRQIKMTNDQFEVTLNPKTLNPKPWRL